MKRAARRLGYTVLRRSLARTFRRIVWAGAWAAPARSRPAVLYSNHHAFHDAQILGYLIEHVLGRRSIGWMEDLDRFPFLGVLGAAPFPPHDAVRRAATIRETVRLMARDPDTILIYFPEATLHRAEEGVRAFPPDRFTRLSRVFTEVQWWPVALRITDWCEARPTALLGGAAPHDQVTGRERQTLQALLDGLAAADLDDRRVLLEGKPGPHERWDFSPTRRLFSLLR